MGCVWCGGVWCACLSACLMMTSCFELLCLLTNCVEIRGTKPREREIKCFECCRSDKHV